MSLWSIISTVVIALGLTSSPVYHLPTIDFVEDGQNKQAILNDHQVSNQNRTALPHKLDNGSLGVKITAQSAAVIDKDSGIVLWKKNADQIRSIASITKLMTAIIFLENKPDWNDSIVLEPRDEANGGTPDIKRGETVRVKDLFHTSLIASDNNATLALVRSTGLTRDEFVKEMNKKAKSLGLENTHFVGPTGLSDDNKSTAIEILQLAKYAFEHEDINAVAGLAEYNFTSLSGESHRIFSTNQLLSSYLDIEAGKTGFINASGYCIVAEVKGEQANVITVVLGSETNPDRFQDLKILTGWILENFDWS
ncbi:D-alanyl-D-alanine carboxypeptidase [Candidatus Parcubacteria bacterium]|jgi:D-alanyl-D-alanine carboxypeptidase|nr:D-alanyl-D-alanine carboxypeptidase [Candidatus Parcubacteria bacterium]MBT7227898.1 D-alanyl-D-alanine carboxypeptidase [Candidatus Parcubacteria bacterium]